MAIDQRASAAHGVGAYADVNGISVFLSPVLVAAATSFLDRPGD